ncbi:MAG: enoyl-CoA hydratase/isomerase family protein [Chloroflexi bacterium]|nr:enoyl-CoA hydratase/isomerase family protein [Chloroflexota bacterium]
MPYENVIYDKSGHIATITMNRPDKLNALSIGLIDDIVAAAEEAEADKEIRVIILKAAGRAFSAGYDITPGQDKDKDEDLYDRLLRFRKTNLQWGKLWNLAKPIVVQVHGYCLAGATDLATSCDIIIAAEDAVFGLPDVRGIESVENHMWTYLVGPQWAKRMMLTGDPIDGKTAERIGLVLKAVPADKLEEEVLTLAGRIANIPLELLAPHKSLINKVMGLMGHAVAQQLAFDTVAITHHSDARRKFSELAEKEGLRAALQHRDGPFGDYTARPRK